MSFGSASLSGGGSRLVFAGAGAGAGAGNFGLDGRVAAAVAGS